jgi:ATP-dependent Clp protease ATP-binding subunit ClpX
LPVIAALAELDEETLLKILTEPKNSIVKQFRKLFEMEHVKLKMTEGALRGIVKEAIKRKTGARGLRAILEDCMLDVMYDLPGQTDLKEVVMTEEAVMGVGKPVMVRRTPEEMAQVQRLAAERSSAPESLAANTAGK